MVGSQFFLLIELSHFHILLCLLQDESSAYYHGYVLAEMSVHQTRAHFLRKYGRLVDEPRVGQDLAEYYWKSGNRQATVQFVLLSDCCDVDFNQSLLNSSLDFHVFSESFRDLVERLTGAALSADAWVAVLEEDLEAVIAHEKVDYDEAVKSGPKYARGENVDLDVR
jgi:hypothetical protein